MGTWKTLSRYLSHPCCEGATASWWSQALGIAVEDLPQLLVRTGDIAKTVPCGRGPGFPCRRRVEKESEDLCFAACQYKPAWCDPADFTEADLALYAVSRDLLLRLLRGVLSLEAGTWDKGAERPVLAGYLPLRADQRIPVYLMHGGACHRPSATLALIDASVPGVLLVPTTAVASQVAAFGRLRVLPLEQMLRESNDGKSLTLSEEGKQAWEGLQRELTPKKADGIIKVATPPRALWGDVHMGISDNLAAVSYRIACKGQKPVSGRVSAAAMGLEDSQGNFLHGWDILSAILESQYLVFDPSKDPVGKGKKLSKGSAATAVSRLNDRLSKVFGIADSSIGFDPEEKVYRAKFDRIPHKEIKGKARRSDYM